LKTFARHTVRLSSTRVHTRDIGPRSSPKPRFKSSLARWLLQDHPRTMAGPHERERTQDEEQHSWWKVMCLTGVDYFSTLGYQPGIAVLAAGALAPLATLILVLVTLFGALPMYKRVAAASPFGDGSISMLEHLLSWWQGKLLVLCLIGFVATGFIITMTLSAADATAHIVENPFTSFTRGDEVIITLLLISLLGAVFLKGFGEAIGIAIILVGIYLGLNIIVVVAGMIEVFQHPAVISNWKNTLNMDYANPMVMIGAALIIFPKLALGLSGFETGVVVMPLVKGDPTDTAKEVPGRIRNTRKLLTTAAIIMSVMLIFSSIVTTLLIPAAEFEPERDANGRALAYLAHEQLGNAFGTIYDISTILILWFAGASAMAGLLNIVPRYLPKYGMAPDWARATRPLVLLFTAVGFIVTILFHADVDSQAGAYATGVLAVITSATIAVTLAARRMGQVRATIGFGIVAAIFVYTTAVTIFGDTQGLQIATIFIVAIIITSLVSRVWRSTELRVESVQLDPVAEDLVARASRGGTLRIIANNPDGRSKREYLLKEHEEREASHIPTRDPVLFLEVSISDASEFAPSLKVKGYRINNYPVLRTRGASVPNTIAAVLMELRDRTGTQPHCYFGWGEGNPLKYLARFILFGEGDVAPVTHEILRRAEPDPKRRPAIHVG